MFSQFFQNRRTWVNNVPCSVGRYHIPDAQGRQYSENLEQEFFVITEEKSQHEKRTPSSSSSRLLSILKLRVLLWEIGGQSASALKSCFNFIFLFCPFNSQCPPTFILISQTMFQSFQQPQALMRQGLAPQWEEVILTRDILFSSLINELTLNKILLQNYMTTKTTNSVSTNSGGENQGSASFPKEEFKNSQEEVEEDDEEQERMASMSNMKNDTKNIPKNYGKAILSFIQKYPKTKEFVTSMGVNYSDFLMHVKRFRKKVNSIEGLKKMWGAGNLNHKMRRCIRILSYIFMRKHCLSYIFHSKVRNFGTHVKYRNKLIEGIENPDDFNHIKDY